MATPACYYATWGAYAIGWTRFLPLAMTTVFSIVSLIYSEVLFFLVGTYFWGMSFMLSIAQQYIGEVRIDPNCISYRTFASPSTETFYTIGLLTLVVTYVVTSSEERPVHMSIYGWVCILLIGFLPPLLLVYGELNTWKEVLTTSVLAIVPTVGFVLALRHLIQPQIACILTNPPFSWWGYESQFLVADKLDKIRAERVLKLRRLLNGSN